MSLSARSPCLRRSIRLVTDFDTQVRVLTQTLWLTRVLRAAAQRSEAAVPDLNLDGVLSAIQRHDSLTTAGGTVQAPSVRGARDLVQLEISYVLPPPASGNLTVQPTS